MKTETCDDYDLKLQERNRKWNSEQSFKDKKSRQFVIKFFNEVFNIKLKEGTKTGIDLVYVDKKIKGGIEIEHGGWEGNLWKCDKYQYQSNLRIKGVLYGSVNIPERKEKYWFEWEWIHLSSEKLKNKNLDKNIFVRTNDDFSQVIIIRPEVIRDPYKFYKRKFWCSNSRKQEPFLCYKKEDVETYDLINGEYRLQR